MERGISLTINKKEQRGKGGYQTELKNKVVVFSEETLLKWKTFKTNLKMILLYKEDRDTVTHN